MNDALFVDTPAPQADLFTDEPAPEGKSLAGFGKNAWEDVKSTAGGIASLAQGLGEHPVNTATGVVKNLPGALINEGKRIGLGELLTGHPGNAAEKFGQAAYDKPLTTALDVLPVAGAAGKALGIGGQAARDVELAADAAKSAPAAAAATAAEEAGVIPIERAIGNTMAAPEVAARTAAETAGQAGKITPKVVPPGPPPTSGGVAGVMDDLQNYISPKVKAATDAVSSQYGKQAGRPGWAANVADYLQEKSQMLAAQDLGATPMQARQIGHEGVRALGQYAIDNDIVSPTNGLRGMRAKNAALLDAAGEKLGALRKAADQLRDPASMPVDVLQEIQARLGPKYAGALHADEAKQFTQAMKAVEESDASHQGLAEVATELNKKANSANKLNQPHGAFTDVANTISDINNQRIKQLLGPQRAAEYEQALKDFGANKKIQSFLARKAGGEVKRLGPGSLTSNLVQKGLDEVGYRVGAKAVNKMSSAVLKNPSIARSLPEMFKTFIHQVEDAGNEGLAHGGIAGADELNEFLSSKYGPKENQ